MRRMRESLPDAGACGARRFGRRIGGGRGDRDDPDRRGAGHGPPLGRDLHRQRALHPGLRVRRQPALHAGACPHRGSSKLQPARGFAHRRRPAVRRHEQGRTNAHPSPARPRPAGAAGPDRCARARAGEPGDRLLYRLQRPQDAAYRAPLPRRDGRARGSIRGPRRAELLLRRLPVPRRRSGKIRRSVGAHHRPLRRERRRRGAVLVPELPGPSRRSRA